MTDAIHMALHYCELQDGSQTQKAKSRWPNYNHCVRLIPIAITTIGLYGSVILESIRLSNRNGDYEISSPLYIIFVLRVVTLVSAIKLFSPLKISSNALQSLITKFRLKHLANVTIFYFAVLYMFALIGVHEIGPLEYHCVSDNVVVNDSNEALELCWMNDDSSCNGNIEPCRKTHNESCPNMSESDNNTQEFSSCVSLDSLSIPDLHCRPSNDCISSCPQNYSCRKVNVGRNFDYYGHYDNLGRLHVAVCDISLAAMLLGDLCTSLLLYNNEIINCFCSRYFAKCFLVKCCVWYAVPGLTSQTLLHAGLIN